MTQVIVAPLVALFHVGFAQDSEPRGIGLLGSPGRIYPMKTFAKLAIRIDEARYLLRYGDGHRFVVSRRGSKLLLVRYTVLNREGYAITYTPGMVRMGVNVGEGRTVAASRPWSATDNRNREIKPNGSVNEMVYFEIPCATPMPRLEAYVGDASPIRFDVTSFAKPLRDPFVAPDGATILDEIEAKPGQRLPLSTFDVAVEAPTWQRIATPSFVPTPTQRVLVVAATLHNVAPYPSDLTKGVLLPELLLEDGKTVRSDYVLLEQNGDGPPEASVPPGRSLRVRYAIKVNQDLRPVALRLTDGVNSGRSLLVRLGPGGRNGS